LSNATKFTEQGYVEYSIAICDFEQATRDGLINVPETRRKERKDNATEFSMGLLQSAEEGKAPCVAEGEDTYALMIQVKDTGCGIPQDRIQQIFEPYSQSKLSDYRKHGGTGLGLSILTKLASILRGSLHVESIEGEGSTFTIYLPIHAPSQGEATEQKNEVNFSTRMDITPTKLPELMPQEQPRPKLSKSLPREGDVAASGRNKSNAQARNPQTIVKRPTLPKFDLPSGSSKVLVVDDNEINLKLLGRMLAYFNIEYETACNGQVAVDIMRRSRNLTNNPDAPMFGLCLMDMQMPVMDGSEAIDIMRKEGVDIPIIALTANALDHHREETLAAGATEFATKPILREDLYRRCCQYLQPSS